MDILGSIMKKMEKPPILGEKERAQRKLQQEVLKKEQEEKEKRVKKFRETINKEIQNFIEDESKTRTTFDPMDKPYRSMLYNIVEDAGLIAHSFGREEVDRRVMVFKEGHVPCEAEMQALRRGEVYAPLANNDTETEHEAESSLTNDETSQRPRRNRNAPPPEYLQKYQKHLGGLPFAKESAMKAQADNRSYGFVSSEQKKDKRTIEETLADIRARKKQKQDD